MLIIFLDTCTWLKLELLERTKQFSTSLLFSSSSIAITHKIREELEHFSIPQEKINKTIIYPIGDKAIYKHALDLGLDEADASLLSNGKIKEDQLYLISEDRAVLSFGRMFKMEIMQLIDLFQNLTTQNILDKTKLYNMVKFLRNQKNITEKKKNTILNWLKTFK
ncbi:MAG: hypothetical protein ACTSQI_05425 [Candidatus Helarchaeota archaeon]